MQNRIKIKVSVKRPNDFIQKLIQENISMYDIKQSDKELEIIIDKEDYEKIKKIKTLKNITITNYYGYEKIKRRIRKYKILCFSIILGILLNIFLSNIILKVEIKTSNSNLQKEIRKDVYSLGLKPFHLKKNKSDITKIKQELLKKDNKIIEWLEIEEQGTKYIITVEEKKETKEEPCPNRNLVAKKKAVIRSIQSSSGEIIKKKNDYVDQGDIIISGTIHNKEEVVSKKCAEGKVLGETWYRVKVEIPQISTKKINKNQYKWKIKIGNKENPERRWEIKKEYNIIDSSIYPIGISLYYLQKIEIQKKEYRMSNVEEAAYKKAEKILKKYFHRKPTIIRKKVLKKSIKNSKIIVDVFFALEEDITSYQPIREEIKEE